MSEEEKKAIEYIKKDLKKADMLEMTVHTDNESVRTVLNLIQKQNKIIDEMANNILQFRADTILPTNIEGIKQFFERKVEE